ncbi:MAG: hypothetical protein E7576_10675 [Ruminococcaceae bacterium]|nr:hypothetical protein [Oscillospiraceae bacterium]
MALYCPCCGISLKNVNEDERFVCNKCSFIGMPLKMKHDISYYQNKAKEMKSTPYNIVLLEEISVNPYFDAKTCREVHDAINRETGLLYEKKVAKAAENKPAVNIPKCPTCGSPKIKTISIASKAAGAFMFGILSRTARSQFQCQNCGYKW